MSKKSYSKFTIDDLSSLGLTTILAPLWDNSSNISLVQPSDFLLQLLQRNETACR